MTHWARTELRAKGQHYSLAYYAARDAVMHEVLTRHRLGEPLPALVRRARTAYRALWMEELRRARNG
jgi:hypothetical protein